MKKILTMGIVLIVVGLGLVLLTNLVVSPAVGAGQQSASVGGGNSVSGGNSPDGGPTSGSGLPSTGCTTVVNGSVFVSDSCSMHNGSSSGISPLIVLTVVGIVLCGAGLFLTAIETISKQRSSFQTKTVT
jgi:hypothetical protein